MPNFRDMIRADRNTWDHASQRLRSLLAGLKAVDWLYVWTSALGLLVALVIIVVAKYLQTSNMR